MATPIFGPARDAEIAACVHAHVDGRTYRGGRFTFCLDCQAYVLILARKVKKPE
jgi:hypothetical protein